MHILLIYAKIVNTNFALPMMSINHRQLHNHFICTSHTAHERGRNKRFFGLTSIKPFKIEKG